MVPASSWCGGRGTPRSTTVGNREKTWLGAPPSPLHIRSLSVNEFATVELVNASRDQLPPTPSHHHELLPPHPDRLPEGVQAHALAIRRVRGQSSNLSTTMPSTHWCIGIQSVRVALEVPPPFSSRGRSLAGVAHHLPIGSLRLHPQGTRTNPSTHQPPPTAR